MNKRKNKYIDKKNDDKWARHFDTLLWLSTSIFIIAIVQLASSSYSHLNIETGLLGILITGCLLYFAASFRKEKHRYMKKNKENKKPELPQWWIYTLLMFFIGMYWLYYIQKIIGFDVIWIGLSWTLIVVILYHKGQYRN